MTESTAEDFNALMHCIADGWNEGDSRKAADCFTHDAVYVEPPDRQLYRGREALFAFFGGPSKPHPPMRMEWHHLAFNPQTQVGFGEYTFAMNGRYHGIVVVRLRDGLIASWREYQYRSDLEWAAFSAENPF